jgi:ABC-type uncharacterized transport system substrate-binding protein
MTIQYRREIAEFAIQKRLPSTFAAKDRVKAGGLMSYGPRYSEMMRRAASLIDKILRGAQPADLPMEQPTTFELVINLKTASAIGLKDSAPMGQSGTTLAGALSARGGHGSTYPRSRPDRHHPADARPAWRAN